MRIKRELYANILIFLIISGLFLSNFGFAQAPQIAPSETMEEPKEMREQALPGILEKIERIWKEEVLPIWQRIYNWFMTNIWPKIERWFKKEVEPRTEEIEKRKLIIEEFKKEKEELKAELSKLGKSLWERFKELIK